MHKWDPFLSIFDCSKISIVGRQFSICIYLVRVSVSVLLCVGWAHVDNLSCRCTNIHTCDMRWTRASMTRSQPFIGAVCKRRILCRLLQLYMLIDWTCYFFSFLFCSVKPEKGTNKKFWNVFGKWADLEMYACLNNSAAFYVMRWVMDDARESVCYFFLLSSLFLRNARYKSWLVCAHTKHILITWKLSSTAIARIHTTISQNSSFKFRNK